MTFLAASPSSDAAPGALGFIVVFGMAVILVFVFRSMSRHIRKVNEAARSEAAQAAASSSQAAASSSQAAASSSGDGATPARPPGQPAASSPERPGS